MQDSADVYKNKKIHTMNQQKHNTEDTLTDIFGSKEMRSPAPTEFIPKDKTAP